MKALELNARKNSILRSFSPSELNKLLPHIEEITIDPKQILRRSDSRAADLYFPVTAVLSIIVPTSDGDTVGLTMIAKEGMADVTPILEIQANSNDSLGSIVCLIPGTAIRIKSEIFRSHLKQSESGVRSVFRYLNLLLTDISLSAVCNRLHSLEQRLARWLLTSVDKGGILEIQVTQEMLAGILGAHRQSVLQVLEQLETKRVVDCERGSIMVRNRQRLQAASCDCYLVGKRKLDGYLR